MYHTYHTSSYKDVELFKKSLNKYILGRKQGKTYFFYVKNSIVFVLNNLSYRICTT